MKLPTVGSELFDAHGTDTHGEAHTDIANASKNYTRIRNNEICKYYTDHSNDSLFI